MINIRKATNTTLIGLRKDVKRPICYMSPNLTVKMPYQCKKGVESVHVCF